MDNDSPVFELRDVSYNYLEGSYALKDINLTVMPKEAVAVVGTNGSGKSTLLKILDALYFPAEGEIKAFGEHLSEECFKDKAYSYSFRRRVGLLFQNPDVQLFSPTVEDEIAFGPLQMGLSKEEVNFYIEGALKILDIEKLRRRASYQLSEGEKKKVALAAIFSLNPEVWLLDEPTADLDPRTQGWMVDFFLSLAEQGKTLVVATHQLELARIISRKIYILGETHSLLAEGSSSILQNEELLLSANLIHSFRK